MHGDVRHPFLASNPKILRSLSSGQARFRRTFFTNQSLRRNRIRDTSQFSEKPERGKARHVVYDIEHSTVARLASFVIGAVVNPERLESVTITDEIERMIRNIHLPKGYLRLCPLSRLKSRLWC